MKKTNTRIKINLLVEISIFTAIGVVLDLIAHFLPDIWPEGSLSIAMVPIFIIGYKWGPKGAFPTAFLIGTIQLIYSHSYVHPIQILLDYPIAYGVVAVSSVLWIGISKRKTFVRILLLLAGMIAGVGCRLISATLAGTYWGSTIPASFVYNLSYLLPSLIACFVLTIILIPILKPFLRIK